jgi:hypothetical protein
MDPHVRHPGALAGWRPLAATHPVGRADPIDVNAKPWLTDSKK